MTSAQRRRRLARNAKRGRQRDLRRRRRRRSGAGLLFLAPFAYAQLNRTPQRAVESRFAPYRRRSSSSGRTRRGGCQLRESHATRLFLLLKVDSLLLSVVAREGVTVSSVISVLRSVAGL
ncbi:hypothetical protein HPB50_004345 [Hyalomma asiaticum]|uniref:Uncharacterized protein n=1 Tax=Hyalomma asiaticum TaxID=266040 RepID=A0ACB7SCJ4_HYAAI|nr:hypothetical protein HPB50_004345 [Hyalomma asiaticum]